MVSTVGCDYEDSLGRIQHLSQRPGTGAVDCPAPLKIHLLIALLPYWASLVQPPVSAQETTRGPDQDSDQDSDQDPRKTELEDLRLRLDRFELDRQDDQDELEDLRTEIGAMEQDLADLRQD